MPDTREKLKSLLMQKGFGVEGATIAADHLIENGVRLEEKQATSEEIKRWIPVTEQKPEENKDVKIYSDGRLMFASVLVYDSGIGVNIANRLNVRPVGIPYLDEQATEGWVWSNGYMDATHWMPLPEPPKEVNNG